mmetsp:Transcript_42719/g.141456  ORF Transcript_42719/g.141456 Transcript_42719/m.141456 type:complete len:763 (+) Transcript_42719:57-2345(+)
MRDARHLWRLYYAPRLSPSFPSRDPTVVRHPTAESRRDWIAESAREQLAHEGREERHGCGRRRLDGGGGDASRTSDDELAQQQCIGSARLAREKVELGRVPHGAESHRLDVSRAEPRRQLLERNREGRAMLPRVCRRQCAPLLLKDGWVERRARREGEGRRRRGQRVLEAQQIDSSAGGGGRRRRRGSRLLIALLIALVVVAAAARPRVPGRTVGGAVAVCGYTTHLQQLRLDKALRRLAVDHGQRVELLKDPVLQLGRHLLHKLPRHVLRTAEDPLRRAEVELQQPIVEHRAVVHVGEGGVGDGGVEEAAEHLLELGGAAEEEADRGGEQLEPDGLRRLLGKVVDEGLQQVGRLGDDVAVLADHPQQRHLGVRLVDVAEEGADAADEALDPVGELSQQVLHRDDGLRGDVVDVDLEQLEELLHHAAAALGHAHTQLADGGDGGARDVGVRLCDVLCNLVHDLGHGRLRRHGGEDVELEELDAGGLVVLAVEVLVLGGEDVGHARREQRDVLEADEALLEDAARDQRHHRRLEPRVHLRVHLRHVLRELEEDLCRGEDDRRVGVAEPLFEQVHDVEGLLRRLGLVARDELEDDALGPLVELLDAVEEVVDDWLVDCHAALGRQDLVECVDAVGHHLRVSVAQHRVELVDHVARGECVGGVVVHLEAGEDRRLAHVRRLVAQPRLDHPWEVLDDVWQAQRRERAEREPASHRVVVAAVFLERVDGEEREVRVGRRVVADVQVHHLFDHVVFGRGCHDHLREEL